MNLVKVDQALESIVYVAVRVTDERQWIDTTTVSLSHQITRNKVEKADMYMPQWAKVNKCIATIRCILAPCLNEDGL